MAPPQRPLSSIIELAVLALWLGASLLLAAVVAPAAFAALPSRTLAGDVVGRVLPTLFYSGIIVSLIAVAVEVMSTDRVISARSAGALVIALACAAALLIGRRIDKLRVSIGGPVDALPADDARRIDFGRLHGLSVGALGVGMLAALFVAVATARRLAARTP